MRHACILTILAAATLLTTTSAHGAVIQPGGELAAMFDVTAVEYAFAPHYAGYIGDPFLYQLFDVSFDFSGCHCIGGGPALRAFFDQATMGTPWPITLEDSMHAGLAPYDVLLFRTPAHYHLRIENVGTVAFGVTLSGGLVENPEPSTWLLIGAGLALVAVARRRQAAAWLKQDAEPCILIPSC